MSSAIFTRVSVRQFEDKEVPNGLIVKILRAAMAAPSAVNQQAWEFFVTTDKKIISKLATVTPYSTPAKNAPVVIIPCYRTENLAAPEMVQIDMAIATENILLEVEELGLGAVMLGIAPFEDRMKAVEEILKSSGASEMGEKFRAFTLIPVGYPKNKRTWEDRYEPSKIHVI
ncbi:MAG: nitroreductase family protein [Synergistaceae bacterium]|nr:nitroreductase family protein [Synergistaceae bacterium]